MFVGSVCSFYSIWLAKKKKVMELRMMKLLGRWRLYIVHIGQNEIISIFFICASSYFSYSLTELVRGFRVTGHDPEKRKKNVFLRFFFSTP